MKIIDNIRKARIHERAKMLKALQVSETLEAESTLKEEIKKMAESNNNTSDNLLSLAELLNNAKLPEILTKMDVFQSTLNTLSTLCAIISESLKKDPEFNQRLLKAAEGYIQNSTRLIKFLTVIVWQKPPFYTGGEPMQIVTTTKKPEDEATETPKEEHARAASGVLILSIRPMMRIHPELEMMSSPSTIKLTDIVLEIPITNSSAEIKLIGSLRP
uniref:Uncharacterized protein n=1 Tax=Tanacetum cinerariifolium TaxID=118510 RepID=A0A699H1Y8_TANCI|nr:hypothetical protein [Tanacetum cinerariifolium]